VGHAKTFQLSAYRLQMSSTLAKEERFLLECMWEKLFWVMSRKFLFQSAPTEDCLKQIADLAEPLSLRGHEDYSDWIHDSYADIQLKFACIRFVISLKRGGTSECKKIKLAIINRFLHAWKRKTAVETSSLTLVSNKAILRKLSNILWSNLLSLLVELVFGSSAQDRNLSGSALKTISSILSSVEHWVSIETFPSMPFKTYNLADLALDCLLLVGLVLSESRENKLGNP
jgi:hypothetical protein